MKRTPFARKVALRRMGKRGLKRQAMNRRLNKLGINHCEIQIPNRCVSRIMLSWAHALKSRFLVTDEDWLRAARCCVPCHQYIEALTHSEMERLVDEAIQRRDEPREEIFNRIIAARESKV